MPPSTPPLPNARHAAGAIDPVPSTETGGAATQAAHAATRQDEAALPANAFPVPHIGIAWMVASALCLAIGNALVRKVSADLHPFQIGFLTNFLVMFLVWPALRTPGDPRFRRQRRRLYLLQAAFGGLSTLTWFYALAHVQLAVATAITFAAPILVIALAGVIFGEKVTLARWLAVAAGFIGVLVIVRPGVSDITPGTLAVLVSTVGMAGGYLFSKQLTAYDTTARMAAIQTFIPVGIGLVPAIVVWRTPEWHTMFWVGLTAAAMYAGRLTMLTAFRNAPASTVMPFDFARLPFIAGISFVMFAEVPDGVAMFGALIIIAASLSVLGQEHGQARGKARARLAPGE